MMKKTTYQQPAMHVVTLRPQQQLLTVSVIAPGDPNLPPAAPEFDEQEEF